MNEREGSGRLSLRNQKHLKKLLIAKPYTSLVNANHQYKTVQQAQTLNTNIEPNEHPKKPNAVQSSSGIPSNITTAYTNICQSSYSRKPPVRYIEKF